jgi:hypothetical protein
MAMASDSGTQNLHIAFDFARKLFMEDPSLSIDTAARRINEGCKRGLVKGEIARIRQEVRQRINSAGGKVVPIVSTKEPFNRPRYAHEKYADDMARRIEKKVKKTEPEVVAPAPPPEPKLNANEKADRVAFLGDWVMANPQARIQDAQKALKERFGVGLNTKYVADTLKVARELAFAPKVSVAAPVAINVAAIARQLRDAGVKKIEIGETSFTVEYRE